ncbi:MAG: ornithine carbamoyltransferase [Thermosediminibacterales bacterium]|nr:ornithine carbamoyltransferase [Thermosediminibacterales bacterium]
MAEDVVFQKIDMKGKDIITIHDLSSKEVFHILKTTEFLKEKAKKGEVYQPLKGKTLGMIFHKASTRTRISFEVAIWQLGGYGLFLNKNDLQLNRGETIADTAKVLSRYLDAIMIRTYDHEDVLVLAEYADIPVINGLTDLTHPCQVLADLFTIYEKKGRLSGLKLAYIGDGNNMAHSLMYGCAKVGMNIAIASPKGYEPKEDIFISAKKDAEITGSSILITNDIEEAVKDADVLYTDVWASMGQEAEREKRIKAFQGYQINKALLKKAKQNAIVMHCLPAHRGEEITDEVMDGPQSVVFDEAENRLHTQKAILTLVM